MLEFIGTGSAFNTKLGNNSAFIKKGKTLFLIDCGSNIFTRIQQANLLDGIKDVYVLITHTHPDHIGSLGDLIFYGYYSMGEIGKPNVTVISPRDLGITDILSHVGVKVNAYNLLEFKEEARISNNDIRMYIKAYKSPHVDELISYGYYLEYFNTKIFYSGDSKVVNQDAIHMLYDGDIDYFYQDTCMADYKGNVHVSLRLLDKTLVLDEFRSKVYCMHLDNDFDVEKAKELKFNVVKSIFE